MKALYANILSGALRAFVAAGALTAVSLFLYLMAFNQFSWYDDEGYVMLTQQGFNNGYALYDEIFTQYGPVSYIFRDFIYRVIPDLSVTHDANRMISLIFLPVGGHPSCSGHLSPYTLRTPGRNCLGRLYSRSRNAVARRAGSSTRPHCAPARMSIGGRDPKG